MDIFQLVDADTAMGPQNTGVSQQELEQAMTRAEDDERDLAAARVARAEASADLADFDERTSTSAAGGVSFLDEEIDPDVLRVEQEMQYLMNQVGNSTIVT